jgi:hypothetical protein
MDSAPVPRFLADTLETMSFGRRAGEWDFEPVGEARGAPSEQVLAVFLECFPWASLHEPPTNEIPDPPEVGGPDHDAGFEASLTLRLYWFDPTGKLGESDLPDAGGLVYDRTGGLVFFTVWPNLFTDTVPLYERRTPDLLKANEVSWQPAAQRNRQRLTTSLACWTKTMPGQILSAESELVEGVRIDGFSDTATPA